MAASASRVVISGAGSAIVNGIFTRRDPSLVPLAFVGVCKTSGWDPAATWARLNGQGAWWESANGSYLYFNSGDNLFWLDSGQTGLGLYVSGAAAGSGDAPPSVGWRVIGEGLLPLPSIALHEAGGEL